MGTIPPTEDAAMAAFLTRVEGKLDSALAQGADHEIRLRSLERAVWVAAGTGVIGGASLSQVITTIIQIARGGVS